MPTKKTKYVAVYRDEDGQLHHAERTSAHPYEFASVVRWSDGSIAVGLKWSATYKGAEACLTADQRANGARVIAVVKAEPQPDLSDMSKILGKLLDGRKD